MSSRITSENPVVKAMIEGTAPRPAQLAASRGILPLAQADLLEILVAFQTGGDPELQAHAAQTLDTQSPAGLEETLRSGDAAPEVLAYFAGRQFMPNSIYEVIIANPRTPGTAIAKFARSTTSGDLLELIALNQQLLIASPGIIDAIIENPHRTAEAERRATETKREFFEKERGAQQIANELRARGKDAAAEFIENAEFAADLESGAMSAEDALFLAQHIEVLDKETDDSWLGLEYLEEIYEESDAQRQATLDKILGELKNEEEEVPGDRGPDHRDLSSGLDVRIREQLTRGRLPVSDGEIIGGDVGSTFSFVSTG